MSIYQSLITRGPLTIGHLQYMGNMTIHLLKYDFSHFSRQCSHIFRRGGQIFNCLVSNFMRILLTTKPNSHTVPLSGSDESTVAFRLQSNGLLQLLERVVLRNRHVTDVGDQRFYGATCQILTRLS